MMKLLEIKLWHLHQNVVPFIKTNHGIKQQHIRLVIQKKFEYQSPHLYLRKIRKRKKE